MTQPKFNNHIGWQLVHLGAVVLIMVSMLTHGFPQPLRGILSIVLVVSLAVWPWRYLVNNAKERFKEDRWG